MNYCCWKKQNKKANCSPPQVRHAWVSTSAHVCPCGQTCVSVRVSLRARKHTWVNLCTRVCICYVHLLSLGSHYETDASEALGKLSLIGLTETHQQVSTLPHKHTNTRMHAGGFASNFTVIFHMSDLCFYILCQIWHRNKNMTKNKIKWQINEMQRAEHCWYVFAVYTLLLLSAKLWTFHQVTIFYYKLISQLFYDLLFSRLII